MATITVRDLPDDVQRRLKQRAVHDFGTAWLELAASYRGEELPLPARSQPRDGDFL